MQHNEGEHFWGWHTINIWLFFLLDCINLSNWFKYLKNLLQTRQKWTLFVKKQFVSKGLWWFVTCTRPKWRFSKEKHFFSPDNQKSKKILQTLMVCVKKWLEIVPVQIGVLPKRNIISFPIPILLLIYQSVAACPKNQKKIQKNPPNTNSLPPIHEEKI